MAAAQKTSHKVSDAADTARCKAAEREARSARKKEGALERRTQHVERIKAKATATGAKVDSARANFTTAADEKRADIEARQQEAAARRELHLEARAAGGGSSPGK